MFSPFHLDEFWKEKKTMYFFLNPPLSFKDSIENNIDFIRLIKLIDLACWLGKIKKWQDKICLVAYEKWHFKLDLKCEMDLKKWKINFFAQ